MEKTDNIGIVRELAGFTTKTKFVDIPKKTTDFVKGLALKTVAGMLVGSTMPAGRKVAKFMKERGGSPEAGIMGCGFKAPIWNAVFADGLFAHAAELEDDRFGAKGTAWDITTFPITFPLAERLRLSGKELLEASAIGMEVLCRTSQFFPQAHMGLSVIHGSVGPAAAAAKALRLSEAETMSAFGLAMSSVPLSYLNFGTDGHYFETAFQCLDGLVAAELAGEGLDSNPDLVAYLRNLLGEERVNPEEIVSGLGTEWQLCDIWVKKYPCCLYQHRYIDALLELIQANNLSYDQIQAVEAHISSGAEEICDRPKPKTVGDLQFCFYHTLGSAILDKDVNFNHINEEKIEDAKSKEARSKVKVIVHRELTPKYAMEFPARVVVKLKDGRELSSERMHIVGSPQEPLSMGRFKDLFCKFTAGVLPDEQSNWAADAIASMEELNVYDMNKLMNMLTLMR